MAPPFRHLGIQLAAVQKLKMVLQIPGDGATSLNRGGTCKKVGYGPGLRAVLREGSGYSSPARVASSNGVRHMPAADMVNLLPVTDWGTIRMRWS